MRTRTSHPSSSTYRTETEMPAVEELFGERRMKPGGKWEVTEAGSLCLVPSSAKVDPVQGESSCLGFRTTDLHMNSAAGGLTRSDGTAQPSKLKVMEGVTHFRGGVTWRVVIQTWTIPLRMKEFLKSEDVSDLHTLKSVYTIPDAMQHLPSQRHSYKLLQTDYKVLDDVIW